MAASWKPPTSHPDRSVTSDPWQRCLCVHRRDPLSSHDYLRRFPDKGLGWPEKWWETPKMEATPKIIIPFFHTGCSVGYFPIEKNTIYWSIFGYLNIDGTDGANSWLIPSVVMDWPRKITGECHGNVGMSWEILVIKWDVLGINEKWEICPSSLSKVVHSYNAGFYGTNLEPVMGSTLNN